MTNQTALVLMPFSPPEKMNPVYAAIKEGAKAAHFHCRRVDERPHELEVPVEIIKSIDESLTMIVDLTGSNRNVLWELGVANGLTKECILITQDRPEELPFDFRGYRVVQYVNNEEGRSKLKDEISEILSSDMDLRGPVAKALDRRIKRNRVAVYSFLGAGMGLFWGLIVSVPAALLGIDFRATYSTEQGFTSFQTFFNGAPAGFICGGSALFFYSLVYNSHDTRPDRPWLFFAELGAGFLSGIIIFQSVSRLDVQNVAAADNAATAYLLLAIFTVSAFGFSFNTQPSRAAIESLGHHTTKTILIFIVALLICAASISFTFKNPYDNRVLIVEALRFALWGIGMSVVQWWLKERRVM